MVSHKKKAARAVRTDRGVSDLTLRDKAVLYWQSHTEDETKTHFKVSRATLFRWKRDHQKYLAKANLARGMNQAVPFTIHDGRASNQADKVAAMVQRARSKKLESGEGTTPEQG